MKNAESDIKMPADFPITDLEREPTVISQGSIAEPGAFVRPSPLVALSESLEGKQLDHFLVGRMIGGGGMGAVFRGRDVRLDREVAIKVIPESRRDGETLRRFRTEAQSAARLDHPNIARVYDIGEDDAWNYIVFEFVDGINLRDLVIAEGPMSIDDAVFTTRQVAEALQHADDRDVVHRDIKPSNVIITSTGVAKVVDMGLARNTAMDRSTADQTASGVTLGTFDYISPEQARDPRDADVRSDLYSLGCTLYYMLTGEPPFPDGTALQKLLNHGSQPPPDPRQWRDDISDQLYAVLAKMMAKRPIDRYQKPLELINDLLLVAQLEGLPRSGSPGTIQMRASIVQRSLVETHLPWVVPTIFLTFSVFWLQTLDSLSVPLELPKPSFRSAPLVEPPSQPQQPLSERLQPSVEVDSAGSDSRRLDPKSLIALGSPNGRDPDFLPAESAPKPPSLPNREVEQSLRSPAPLIGPNPIEATQVATAVSHSISRTIYVGSSQTAALSTGSHWSSSLSDALAQAALNLEIETIELTESVELTHGLRIPRSGLTLQSAPGSTAEILFIGEQGHAISPDTWIEIQRLDLRCERLHFRCRDDSRQAQTVFSLQAGGQLALNHCHVTMESGRDTPLGNCVAIGPERARDPATSFGSNASTINGLTVENEPATVSILNSFVRGNLNLVSMPTARRAEFTLEGSCAILEGKALTIRATETDRGLPVVRWNMLQSTLICKQGFAAVQTSFAQRAPLTLMRTAKQCVFWSPALVPHLTVEGIVNDDTLVDLLQLRGEENAYDQNIATLCQCRFADGHHIDFSFRDATGEWFRERGNDSSLRWQNPVPSSDRPMHEQLPEQYRLRNGVFVPGFPLTSVAAPPRLEHGQ